MTATRNIAIFVAAALALLALAIPTLTMI